MTDAQRCRRNGWGVGTRLRAWGHDWGTVIEITAIGEQMVLAKCVEWDGVPVILGEGVEDVGPGRWRRI